MNCSDEVGHPRYQAEGEAADQVFDSGELLYRRYARQHFVDGQLLPAAFRFPGPSFNRQKYSVADDVLHPDCCDGNNLDGYGILECSATDLPTPINGDDGKEFNFAPVHRPCPCCYAHTEVWCVLDGEPVDQPSKAVREKFRVGLARKMAVRKEASA